MDAVTYPHGGVVRRINELFVAARPQIDKNKELAARFGVTWTPGFIFLDPQEKTHYRAIGYHPPETFEHLLHIGRGMIALDLHDYPEATRQFASVAEDAETSELQPESFYWLGIAHYKNGEPDRHKRTWIRLLDKFPDTLWARKVSFIRAPKEAL